MNQEEEKPIRRAFCLTVVMDADTKKDLVSALYNFAIQIDREEITTGVMEESVAGRFTSFYTIHRKRMKRISRELEPA